MSPIPTMGLINDLCCSLSNFFFKPLKALIFFLFYFLIINFSCVSACLLITPFRRLCRRKQQQQPQPPQQHQHIPLQNLQRYLQSSIRLTTSSATNHPHRSSQSTSGVGEGEGESRSGSRGRRSNRRSGHRNRSGRRPSSSEPLTINMGLLPLEFTDGLTDSPYFRETLTAHERELDRTNVAIKHLIKDIKDLIFCAKSKCTSFFLQQLFFVYIN